MDTIPTSWDEPTDVVVVGTGAAGLTAAVRAADAGARVLVLEKTAWSAAAPRSRRGSCGCR